MNRMKFVSCILLTFTVTATTADRAQAFYGFRCFGSCGVSGGHDYSGGHRRPIMNTLHATAQLAGGALRGTWQLAHGSARILTAPVRGLARHWGSASHGSNGCHATRHLSSCSQGGQGGCASGCGWESGANNCGGNSSGCSSVVSGESWSDQGEVLYDSAGTYGTPLEAPYQGPVEIPLNFPTEVPYQGPVGIPLEAHPVPSVVAPPTDASAFAAPRSKVRFASFQRQQAPSFSDGLHAFWAGDLADASRAFAARAHANANDPLSLYFLALAQHRAGNRAAAETNLAAAIEREETNPIAGWGKRMQRVQGSSRLWVEKARSLAGVGR